MLGFYTLVGVGIELGDNAVLQRCMIPSITLLMFFLTPTTPKLRTADVGRTRQLLTMPNYRTKKDLEKKREELSLTTANKGPFTFEVRKNLGFWYPLPPLSLSHSRNLSVLLSAFEPTFLKADRGRHM